MTNMFSGVKSALRRGSNSDSSNNLSPESSRNHMNSLASTSNSIVSDGRPSSLNQSTSQSNEIKRTITSSSSTSDVSLDLKKQTSNLDGGENSGKSKKQLKAEKKALEDAEIAKLAAAARERGETMKLDEMYLPSEFTHRGLALQGRDFFGTFGKRM